MVLTKYIVEAQLAQARHELADSDLAGLQAQGLRDSHAYSRRNLNDSEFAILPFDFCMSAAAEVRQSGPSTQTSKLRALLGAVGWRAPHQAPPALAPSVPWKRSGCLKWLSRLRAHPRA
jgi:hypothetical protein